VSGWPVIHKRRRGEFAVTDQMPALKDRVLAELRRKPGMKAAELAELLGVDRREVNRCLAHELVGQVQQASDYRWRPVDAARPAATAPIAATSEIGKLCRYYLECIGQDMDEGLSTFASSKYGEPGLCRTAQPAAGPRGGEIWFNAPGVGRILGKVRQDRAKLVAWLGLPRSPAPASHTAMGRVLCGARAALAH
jgi:predicted transcriptional regulator